MVAVHEVFAVELVKNNYFERALDGCGGGYDAESPHDLLVRGPKG